MPSRSPVRENIPAAVLALFVGEQGAMAEREWEVLDRFDTYSAESIACERFAELAQAFAEEFNARIEERLWLSAPDLEPSDQPASAVQGPEEHSLFCRLHECRRASPRCASRVDIARGDVSRDERQLTGVCLWMMRGSSDQLLRVQCRRRAEGAEATSSRVHRRIGAPPIWVQSTGLFSQFSGRLDIAG